MHYYDVFVQNNVPSFVFVTGSIEIILRLIFRAAFSQTPADLALKLSAC